MRNAAVPPIAAERAGQIRSIVCEVLGIDDGELTDTALFAEDLGADSLTRLELLATLEVELDVEVDESEFERLVNLAAVYDVLGSLLDR